MIHARVLFAFISALAVSACAGRQLVEPPPPVPTEMPPPAPAPTFSYEVPPGWVEIDRPGIGIYALLERESDGAWMGAFRTERLSPKDATSAAAREASISYHCSPNIVQEFPVSGSWATVEVVGCEEGGDAVFLAHARWVGVDLVLFQSYWPFGLQSGRDDFRSFFESFRPVR